MQSGPALPVDVDAVRSRVAWRILPLAFLLYIMANLDRANAGFAKLSMAPDLGFSERVFGYGFGIFFAGYLLLAIPGALIVERWSARRWFALILISWGLLSALTGFVRTPGQFYFARFLLGIAEAGFFPGIIVYFTHWFPGRDRAKAISALIMAVPFSLALGAPISGLLLGLKWIGMHGWQWLFILEGAPAILIGVLALFVLSDRPRDAKWLRPEERDWLQAQLDTEARSKESSKKPSVADALMLPQIWILALGILAANTGGYALTFWLPTVIKGLSGSSNNSVLGWSGLIHAFGLISVFASGQSSDRTGERKWHCVAGQVLTAVFLGVSVIPGQPFWLVVSWLCGMGLAAYFWATPFLGPSHSHSDGLRGGGRGRPCQHMRERGWLPWQQLRGRAQGPRVWRPRLPALLGRLLPCGRPHNLPPEGAIKGRSGCPSEEERLITLGDAQEYVRLEFKVPADP